MGVLGDPVSLDPYVGGLWGETVTPMFDRLIQYDHDSPPLPYSFAASSRLTTSFLPRALA